MVPASTKSSLGLEYFCAEGDETWTMADVDLIELAKREVDRIGLVGYADIEDGCVVRVPKAYPVYDSSYSEHLQIIREFTGRFENCQSIGRNGLHRYNNQDHAMLTGLLAVRNAVLGQRNDLWSINTDQEYLEQIPDDVETRQLEETLSHVFRRLDRVAFGVGVGLILGLSILGATLALVLKGGVVVGPNLGLLAQYFPGYRVTAQGALLGFLYGFVTGFIGGWLAAFIRNASVFFYMAMTRRRAERQLMRKLLEYF